jgi:hypothetical protein
MTTITVLAMCNCMHKGGHEMEILDIDGDLMVLMNSMSLKCTWKTCEKKIGLEVVLPQFNNIDYAV